MNQKAKFYIEKLDLKPHPEGGYYKEIYRSAESIIIPDYTLNRKKQRNFSTSIYFLLEGNDKSHFHKLTSDEIWHFYDGSDIKIILLDELGNLTEVILGKEAHCFQYTIKKNLWFAAELIDKKSFALIGCTVSPGFEFEDFELADRNYLLSLFPQHEKIIKKFTRNN
ncbi:MAG: cupin domain-containing protein [Ignavibacterium sp.]|nr:cupin domain-containing protein [Ignavibacterium sp.]MCX7612166.1 cupin domain-containing protein [Ignavibacterium sp.]MDW8374084.1 cupin domain-containing protein [Ignavibacteriales bacterium]